MSYIKLFHIIEKSSIIIFLSIILLSHFYLGNYNYYTDCENGDVRLVGGSKSTEGTVEVCFENLWGLVADGAWDAKDAAIICKILGHSEDCKYNLE